MKVLYLPAVAIRIDDRRFFIHAPAWWPLRLTGLLSVVMGRFGMRVRHMPKEFRQDHDRLSEAER